MSPFRFPSAAALVVVALGSAAWAADKTPSTPGLSPHIGQTEYLRTITDIFGAGIAPEGQFEPEKRAEGLLAAGGYAARMSSDGVEHYEALARSIAAQVVGPQRRAMLFKCAPKDAKRKDDACARTFLSATGRFLFRRPMTEAALNARVKVAGMVANESDDFYAGIEIALANMLMAPEFLYRVNVTEPDPANPGQRRLDSYSKAAVLSSYLWGTAPDNMLLQAAEKGELQTPAGLQRQVDRMTSSPRMEGGIRAFFSDMLGFDEFDTVAKDGVFFPNTTPTVLEHAPEQTLRTIVEVLMYGTGDYRDLFTTPRTFLTRPLAVVYGVPLNDGADYRQYRWVPYTYDQGDPRAGILSQVSFVALHSPPARSSPTLRGKALRELLMCQAVPDPPANVDFTIVEDDKSKVNRTARDRLSAHAVNPVCAGCHKITDPIGLALENFDGGGAFRTEENGAAINTSGEYRGAKFSGVAELAKLIRDDPAVPSCVAKRSFAYASGRTPATDDAAWQKIEQDFKASSYNVISLIREIALSPLLYRVPS